MTFGKDNLIWIAPTAAVLGSAITLAIVGFGAGNAPETASAPAAPTGSASEQANATEAAVDPLSGFNVLVQIPQSGATAQTAPLDGDSIVS